MKLIVSENFQSSISEIRDLLENYDQGGISFGKGARNQIKVFKLQRLEVNIKAFKKPNFINKIVYRFFRRSKAERSFTYAHKLISKNIGTPQPIAYAEETAGLSFTHSYYVSEQLPYNLTYRELVQEKDYPEWEKILRAFTRFTYQLHEQGVEFLDHSPGNTLIQKTDGGYNFFLVDLNRMNFKELSFEERMKNFSRLTPHREMVKIMASEYAILTEKPQDLVFERMWHYTKDFQRKFQKKKAAKRKLQFWKNSPSKKGIF